jgi:glycosyltransferase involved in cell wall biosynthesis
LLKLIKIAVNGASVQNASGAYVIEGHLRAILSYFGAEVKVVIFSNGCDNFSAFIGDNRCELVRIPSYAKTTYGRMYWETFRLGRLLASYGVNFLIQPSGYAVPGLKVSQVVISQNPFAFYPEFHKSNSRWLKNYFLRIAYCNFGGKNCIFYGNSIFMRDLIQKSRVSKFYSERVLYQGVYEGAPQHTGEILSFFERQRTVLAVSGVEIHKRFDLIIKSFVYAARFNADLRLKIVGKVDNDKYNDLLKEIVCEAGLSDRVDFLGWVSRDKLVEYYRTSLLYISLSECESFGIPAVEAQLWGTPAIVADCCAPPEICGSGAVLVPKGDSEAAGEAILTMAANERHWKDVSALARRNALRFEWSRCSAPLIDEITKMISHK